MTRMNAGSAWLLLIGAGLLEVSWLIAMKHSEGFTKPGPTVLLFALGALSFYLLSLCLNVIPIGTAYVVWTGIGAVGGAIVGILLFDEPRHAWRLTSIALVLAGVV